MKARNLLIVYFIGVVFCWLLTFSHIRKDNVRPVTYGDIAFCTFISLFSWLSTASMVCVIISEAEFWDTPV